MQYLKDLLIPVEVLYPTVALDHFENVVYQNYESFLKEFMPDAWDLVKVRFSSTDVEFVAVMDNGQHVVNGVTVEKFVAWCKKVVV